ncbi:restriction endonuclease, partial [bacterium]|nr:restriction endonuclease [bacterium]
MSKVDEAKIILAAFGLSKRQQNDRSARVLLSLLNIKERDSWKKASINLIGIHEMISFIA